ncbi:MAG: hypothetical protein P4L33_17130 [Capsulimonadaceae bacterium]|nr:hypothetical protein [Capsulimonadaceae bacterium]
MQAFRLTPLVVTIVGALACIIAPVLIFFLMIKPTNAKIAEQQAILDQNQQYVSPGALVAAQRKLDDANKQLAVTQQQWDFIMKTKNPVIDLSDRFIAWQQYMNEIGPTLYPMVNRFWLRNVYAKKRDPNAAIPLGTIAIGATPNPDPNSVKGPILTIPLTMVGWTGHAGPNEQATASAGGSSIAVMGTFQADLNNVAQWNKFSRIVQIDGLSLAGYSPFITATYSAKIYEFVTNADKPGPDVPSSAK